LLLDGERKSSEPMASRIAGAEVQALRQLVGPSPWAVEAVQRRLAHQVVDLLSAAAVWIIDESSFPNVSNHVKLPPLAPRGARERWNEHRIG
jgi:SRSO17 transposase